MSGVEPSPVRQWRQFMNRYCDSFRSTALWPVFTQARHMEIHANAENHGPACCFRRPKCSELTFQRVSWSEIDGETSTAASAPIAKPFLLIGRSEERRV